MERIPTQNRYITSNPRNTCSANTTCSILEALDFATILKAFQTLSSEIRLDKLLTSFLNIVTSNAIASKCVLVLLWDNQLRVEAIAELEKEPIVLQGVPIDQSPDIPKQLIFTVQNSLEPLVINDTTSESKVIADAYILQHKPKSLLCTPIISHGKLLGILYLENNFTKVEFTEKSLEIINLLCTQAAISLENARLYQKSQKYAQQLKRSLISFQEKAKLAAFRAEINFILTQNHNLQKTLQCCAEAIVKYLDAAFARIWILNAKEQILELQASAGMYTHINGSHGQVSVGKLKIGLIAEERKPHLTNQVQTDPRVSDKEWAKREGMVAFAGYPLIFDGELIGVLAMFSRKILSESVLEYLKSLASEIAMGIKRKKSEEALRQKAQELENTLHKLQQTQMQLIQSEKMSSLGNLVSGVAHEINNPINFIKASICNVEDYMQNLCDYIQCIHQHYPQLAPAVTKLAEEIDLQYLIDDLPNLIYSMKGASERIIDISTSLRTFSRADTVEKVACNIHEGIDSTLLILKYRLKANERRPAILVMKKYGYLPLIKCFLGQLNQVFMNILANAIDAIDDDSQKYSFDELKANPKQISITTEVLKSENMALIRIQDNACGMSEAVKANIFDHLFTTKDVGKGTGLGLAIARQIVEETHGGELVCYSTLGKGTEFAIKLPL